MMKKILLAEDDIDFGTMLKHFLTINKYEVTWAKNGEEALHLFQEHEFDICILDVMMPVMDGFTCAEKMIAIKPETPFLFLTARKTKEDRIKGLKLGADDYVSKPFEVEELIFRIKNIIKRTAQQHIPDQSLEQHTVMSIGQYTFDFKNQKLSIDDEVIQLTKRESKILLYLYKNKNQLIKRESILQTIWKKTDFFSGRSMDVFISRIRKYLKKDPNISIVSQRDVGIEFIIN